MSFEFLVWSELVVIVNKDIAHDSWIIHVITRFLNADLDGTIFAYDYRRDLHTSWLSTIPTRTIYTYDIPNVS